MRGKRQNDDLQVTAVLREYRSAKRIGAVTHALKIRLANTDLTGKFNEIDRELEGEKAEVA